MTVTRVEDGTNAIMIYCSEREGRQIGFIIATAAIQKAAQAQKDMQVCLNSAEETINKHFSKMFDEWAKQILDKVGL